jgi:hypothetical protein
VNLGILQIGRVHGRGISLSQGFYLHGQQHREARDYVFVWGRIRTHDRSVEASRPRGCSRRLCQIGLTLTEPRNYSAWQQAELQLLPRCGITVPGNRRNYIAWEQAELQRLATGGITAPAPLRNYSAWQQAELQYQATGGITVPGNRRNYSTW